MIEPIIDSLEYKEITDEQYFSSEYWNYISNSRLALINPNQGGSAETFLENGHKTTSSLVLGSAVHELVLQPEEFELAPKLCRPTAKLGAMADELYSKYSNLSNEDVIKASDKVDYYKGKMDERRINAVINGCEDYWNKRSEYETSISSIKDQIYLDDTSYDKCVSCVTSVKNNHEIQKLLHPSETALSMNEAALFMDFKYTEGDKECIIKFKSKLDNFTIDGNSIVLNDLKTTGHYVDQFKDSFEKYHYYRQGAVYSYLLTLYAKKYHNIETIDSLKCNFLLVSTIPTFKSGVFSMNKTDMERGWNEFVSLMNAVGHVTVREI